MRKVILFKVQFFTTPKADRVNNEMRMYMRCVRVCGNNYFVVTPLLRKLQGSSVSFLRSYIFIRVERLHKMKIHFTVTLAMLKFRADEFSGWQLIPVTICRSLKVVFFSCTTYFSTADRPARFWPLGLLIAVTVAMSHTFFSRISLSIF